jgi:putative DNA primase/helicase
MNFEIEFSQNKIDFENANRIAASMIQRILPGGRIFGHDYVVRSPLRADKNPGSFRVNLKYAYYKDFATGEAGDLVDLYSKINNLSQIEAAKQILGDTSPATVQMVTSITSVDGELVVPVPEEFMQHTFEHYQYGLPSEIYKYRDIAGNILFVVARYNKTSGGKTILPWTLRRMETKAVQWKSKGYPDPRPLYNLEKLGNNPNLPVIVVEGEKCVEALQKIFSEYVVTSWQGGANAVDKSDFSPLFGRSVFLWGDNDEPGNIAIEKIRSILLLKSTVKVVKIPLDKPVGWDCWDAINTDGMKKQDIINLINPQVPENKKPYRTLGHDHGTYYVFPKGANQVIGIGGGSLGKKTLLMIAPLAYWEMEYPSNNGIQWDLAVDSFIRECERKGSFDSTRVRGRGCWIDSERIILHLGDKLQMNGVAFGLDDINTRYIYETRPSLPFPDNDPATYQESENIFKIFNMLNWESPAMSRLIAGWCFLAPICGVLDWRPHGWLTGPAGSGKSWVLSKIISPLLGENVVYALGGSSAPGIVQKLQSDSIPILIEEAEQDNAKQKFLIDDLLTVARQSSSESGASIFKGTQIGRSLNYSLRSMFLFNSISVGVKHHADESRVTVFALKEDIRPNKVKLFHELSVMVNTVLTDYFCSKIRSRAIKLVPVIRHNAKVFSRAVAEILSNQRAGDQLGTLLAGCYNLLYDGIATQDDAILFLRQIDLNESATAKDQTDEETCLNTILQYQLRTVTSENRPIDITIGELVFIASSNSNTEAIRVEDAINILKRSGIMVDVEEYRLIIANNSYVIKRILTNTPWDNNYGRMLKRLPTAKITQSIRFTNTHRDRGVSVLLSWLFGEENFKQES